MGKANSEVATLTKKIVLSIRNFSTKTQKLGVGLWQKS